MENLVDKIIEDSCGKDEKNKPKAAATLSLQLWNPNTDEMRDFAFKSVYKPVIKIEKHGSYIQVDLTFLAAADADLRTLWALFEKYGEFLDKVNEESVEIPIAFFTIVPVKHDGQYYIEALNPIVWVLQPERPGASSNVLRILFEAEQFSFYESDNAQAKELAERESEEEVQREMAYREQQEKTAERFRLERQEFQDKRNKEFEESRKNRTYL